MMAIIKLYTNNISDRLRDELQYYIIYTYVILSVLFVDRNDLHFDEEKKCHANIAIIIFSR